MIHAYFTERGLASLELILRSLPAGVTIAHPDFICDEVIDLFRLVLPTSPLRPYHIKPDLTPDWLTVPPCDVFYGVDYFGQETDAPIGAAFVIRDGVWIPWPNHSLADNEFWFSSYRKWAWPNRGSILLACRPLDAPEVAVKDVGVGMREFCRPEGWVNFSRLHGCLEEFAVPYSPGSVSVFPMLVCNRTEVLSLLADYDIRLPGMWANRYGFKNDLYDTLMLVPCDSRFSVAEIDRRAKLIRSIATPVQGEPHAAARALG